MAIFFQKILLDISISSNYWCDSVIRISRVILPGGFSIDNHAEFKKGILFALGAHLLWGILLTYWRFIHGISAFEILAYHIILVMAFMILMIFVLKKS